LIFEEWKSYFKEAAETIAAEMVPGLGRPLVIGRPKNGGFNHVLNQQNHWFDVTGIIGTPGDSDDHPLD